MDQILSKRRRTSGRKFSRKKRKKKPRGKGGERLLFKEKKRINGPCTGFATHMEGKQHQRSLAGLKGVGAKGPEEEYGLRPDFWGGSPAPKEVIYIGELGVRWGDRGKCTEKGGDLNGFGQLGRRRDNRRRGPQRSDAEKTPQKTWWEPERGKEQPCSFHKKQRDKGKRAEVRETPAAAAKSVGSLRRKKSESRSVGPVEEKAGMSVGGREKGDIRGSGRPEYGKTFFAPAWVRSRVRLKMPGESRTRKGNHLGTERGREIFLCGGERVKRTLLGSPIDVRHRRNCLDPQNSYISRGGRSAPLGGAWESRPSTIFRAGLCGSAALKIEK